MIYKLYTDDQKKLLSLPESGMGYQLIQARPNGEYSQRQFVALNAEILVDNDRTLNENFTKLFSRSFSDIKNQLPSKDLRDIQLVSKQQFNILNERTFSATTKTVGAKDGPTMTADGKSWYVRLSAYQDDRRVDKINKCLLPGTYTTTLDDYVVCVTSNDDPLERYALPNDEIIQWAFYVQPASNDTYRFGIVQPEFNKRGGGIECLFENGTSFDTFKLEKDMEPTH